MRKLTAEELARVSGGCEYPKGNNGWGNGDEGINNGSDEGGTAGSKIDELWTQGDGPRPEKFTTR